GVLRRRARDARRGGARAAAQGPEAGRAAARGGASPRSKTRRDRRGAGARVDGRSGVREGPRYARAGAGDPARPDGAGVPQGAAAARGGEEHVASRAAARGGRAGRGHGAGDHRSVPGRDDRLSKVTAMRDAVGMVARFAAGAARLPFWPLRNYMGTDLPRVNPRIRHVTCPYTGEMLATVPALNPDVSIIHAQRADARGNTQIWGLLGVQKEAAFASGHVIVVVEELVDEA